VSGARPPAVPGIGASAVWCAIFLAVLLWSGIAPYDRYTWALEVAPAIVAFAVLATTRRRAPLTGLVYGLVLLHCVVLMVGGHYTYARVPAFDWLRDTFDLSRNHYDRVGHFVQGFVPAMVAREVLLRASPLGRGPWLTGYVFCFCLAVSASYELIEWWVALLSEEAAESFLGTQGDPFDTQSDMFLCAIGTLVALACLSRVQDRALGLR
jgi:putative membrane protein